MPKQTRKRSAATRSKPPTPESTPEKGSLPKSSDKGIDAPTGRDGSDVPAGRGAADVHSAAAAQLACGSVDVAAKDPDATPEGGPAQQALPPNAAGAGNDSSMTDACPGSSGLKSLGRNTKRKWKPSIVKELLSVKSRLDFGEQGRANASTLEDKCSANGSQMSGVVTVVETERNERKFVDTPTSSGGISGKACRARMESGAELRGVYHNSSAKTHRECNTHAFGGCKCGGMPGGAPAAVVEQGPSAKDCSSVGTGHAAGGTAGEAMPSALESSHGAGAPMVDKPPAADSSGLVDNQGTALAGVTADKGEPSTQGSSHGAAAGGGAEQSD